MGENPLSLSYLPLRLFLFPGSGLRAPIASLPWSSSRDPERHDTRQEGCGPPAGDFVTNKACYAGTIGANGGDWLCSKISEESPDSSAQPRIWWLVLNTAAGPRT